MKAAAETQAFTFLYDVHTETVAGMRAMVVKYQDFAAALFWRQDVPVYLLRKEDQTKPWSLDDWAFLCTIKVEEQEPEERQRLIYPGFVERYKVVEIFADWQEAVRQTVMRVYMHVVTEPLLRSLQQTVEDPKW